jgi:hypothetical protein
MSKTARTDFVQKSMASMPGPGHYNDETKTFGKDV